MLSHPWIPILDYTPASNPASILPVGNLLCRRNFAYFRQSTWGFTKNAACDYKSARVRKNAFNCRFRGKHHRSVITIKTNGIQYSTISAYTLKQSFVQSSVPSKTSRNNCSARIRKGVLCAFNSRFSEKNPFSTSREPGKTYAESLQLLSLRSYQP